MQLRWSGARHLPVDELRRRLDRIAVPVGKVRIADLVPPAPGMSNGLYFFFARSDVAYVGRAKSRAFVERIPAHFDTREEGWFGTLLKLLAASKKASPAATRQQVLPEALGMRLALLLSDDGRANIAVAETALRHAFAPTLNAPKRPRPIDPRASLDSLSRGHRR